MSAPHRRDPSPARPPRAGDLLISSVAVDEGTFVGTVILIIDHDESGTLGVILNRYAEPRLESVLPAWASLVSSPRVLFNGGPVSANGAICLAALVDQEEDPPGFRRVFDGVGLLHLDTPTEIVGGAYADLRIFAGYSGWDSGQLASEMSLGWWWVADTRYDDVFGDQPEDLWRRVLRRQPSELAYFSTWVDDPELN
ncbi:YqgE/AlgH family protein [Propionibacteriaceae bacterium Y2011]|uniref:YqgE/AlgH family protein n=1 Tax=Microlunatus sp. Y2014 TaxID=3418488 RepID=UPI003B4FA515